MQLEFPDICAVHVTGFLYAENLRKRSIQKASKSLFYIFQSKRKMVLQSTHDLVSHVRCLHESSQQLNENNQSSLESTLHKNRGAVVITYLRYKGIFLFFLFSLTVGTCHNSRTNS